MRPGTEGFTDPGKPPVSPIRRSPLAVTGEFDSPGGTLVATGRKTPSDATGFPPRPELFVHPTMGWGVLIFPGSPPLEAEWSFLRLPTLRSPWRSIVKPRARAPF